MAGARLVSLVGPGGVGKTRLGVRIATDLGRAFESGAWWVELAEVRDPALVPNAAVAALDLRDQAASPPLARLLAHLRDRQLLLLLDNCEHVLESSAHLVVEILRAAPRVRVITTSREPLQVPGEHVIPVSPLELPLAGEALSLGDAQHSEAVTLFSERAAQASGTFALNWSNYATVADLCRRLDGLPLAIELAAVRTRVLTPEQILTRLTDRFALLTGGGRAALPRQQTLRTAVDWSHDLLTAAEQTLLRRLCVFAGRFTVDDVEWVCAFDEVAPREQALDLVSALVDKSLAIKEDVGGIATYRLHETMREYAAIKLREAGEEDHLDQRFIEYYRTRSRDVRAAHHAKGHGRHRTVEWLRWVELEIDNFRAALQKCVVASDWRAGLEIATSIGFYWVARGNTESVRWLDELLGAADGSPDVPVRAYHFRGWLSVLVNDPIGAQPWLDRAIAAARSAEQLPQLAESLAMASTAASMAGDTVGARRLLDDGAMVAQTLDHYPASIGLIQAQASVAFSEGDPAAAEAASVRGVRLSREAGDLYYQALMLINRARAAMLAGDAGTSKRTAIEGLRIAREIDDRLAQYTLLHLLSWHAASSNHHKSAVRLLGAADSLGFDRGSGMAGQLESVIEAATRGSMEALGASRFDAEYETGRHLTRDTALRLALDEPGRADDHLQEDGVGPLAKREAEVAKLIAEGLTNKEIGARLFISERTVATHVRNVMNKLGFNSRAQVASWMTARA
jgi:predicted ATPase/DNA-binding NarL/FixJ family response regulator